MPPYAVHCAACAADKSLLYVRRHWTGCSCHPFSSLYWQKGWAAMIYPPPSTHPPPPKPDPPSLPSSCPLLGLQFLSRGSVWLGHGSRGGIGGVQFTLSSFFFLFLFLMFSVLCRATGGKQTVPWQHWQLKTCICLSCTLAVCFSLCSRLSTGECQGRQRCQGSRWPQERNTRRKK